MAGKGYTVAIASDTKNFKRGVDTGIIQPVEDAQQALTELGRGRGVDKLEADLKSAQRATENLKRSAQDTGNAFQHDAGANVQSFKEEAVQNLSEVASSFTGDMSQMADGVQGLTGGLASALTPGIGIPVAIIGAIAGSFLAQWQENAERVKQQISDMYDDMAESGTNFLSDEFIKQGLTNVYKDQFDTVIARSKELGETRQQIALAMAGDEKAISAILQDQANKRDAEIESIKNSGKSLSEQAAAIDGVNAKYSKQNDWLNDVSRATDTASQKAKALNDTINGMTTLKYIDIVANADFSDFNRKFAAAQRKAAQGISVGTAFKGQLLN